MCRAKHALSEIEGGAKGQVREFNRIEPSAAKPQPNQYFTTETQSSQRSEYFLIKNSLLCALSASAVTSLLIDAIRIPLEDLRKPRKFRRIAMQRSLNPQP
jgi:hypothetical protein